MNTRILANWIWFATWRLHALWDHFLSQYLYITHVSAKFKEHFTTEGYAASDMWMCFCNVIVCWCGSCDMRSFWREDLLANSQCPSPLYHSALWRQSIWRQLRLRPTVLKEDNNACILFSRSTLVIIGTLNIFDCPRLFVRVEVQRGDIKIYM